MHLTCFDGKRTDYIALLLSWSTQSTFYNRPHPTFTHIGERLGVSTLPRDIWHADQSSQGWNHQPTDVMETTAFSLSLLNDLFSSFAFLVSMSKDCITGYR